MYLLCYQTDFCSSKDLGLTFLPPRAHQRGPLKAHRPPCARGLVLELISLSCETKYSRHIVSKKVHSITKLLSTGRLLPFITCERWNSPLVKGNGCFTDSPQINICRHFLFLLCYKKVIIQKKCWQSIDQSGTVKVCCGGRRRLLHQLSLMPLRWKWTSVWEQREVRLLQPLLHFC